MSKTLVPLIFALIVTLQDAHIVFDIDGCSKDNLLIAMILILGLCAVSRQLLLRGFWLMLIAMQTSFLIGDIFFTDYLPDTWSSTEDRLFGGLPVIQISATVIVLGLCVAGVYRKQLRSVEAAKCCFSLILIIVSAQLWLFGNENMAKEPLRAWNDKAPSERVLIIDEKGVFVGRDWLIDSTDYPSMSAALKNFWTSGANQHALLAPRQGYDHPSIYRFQRSAEGLLLTTQPRDMAWGANMVWIWEYVLSFVLVFIEAALMARLVVNLFHEKKLAKIALPH